MSDKQTLLVLRAMFEQKQNSDQIPLLSPKEARTRLRTQAGPLREIEAYLGDNQSDPEYHNSAFWSAGGHLLSVDLLDCDAARPKEKTKAVLARLQVSYLPKRAPSAGELTGRVAFDAPLTAHSALKDCAKVYIQAVGSGLDFESALTALKNRAIAKGLPLSQKEAPLKRAA